MNVTLFRNIEIGQEFEWAGFKLRRIDAGPRAIGEKGQQVFFSPGDKVKIDAQVTSSLFGTLPENPDDAGDDVYTPYPFNGHP